MAKETDLIIKTLDKGKVILLELSCRALNPNNPRRSSIQCTLKSGERIPLEISFQPDLIEIAKPDGKGGIEKSKFIDLLEEGLL